MPIRECSVFSSVKNDTNRTPINESVDQLHMADLRTPNQEDCHAHLKLLYASESELSVIILQNEFDE